MPRDHKLIVEEIQRVLKEKTKRYSFKKLDKEIIQTGACVECGSCVAGCPVDAITGNRINGRFTPELTGKCISCGVCYAMCPRTHVLEEDLIGNVKSAWKVRSLGESNRQNGGAVTAILTFMIRSKIVDGAVVACQTVEQPWLPDAKLIKGIEDIEQCSGTIYTHAQVVKKLLEGFSEGLSKLAVVGTACNIESINRMETHPAGLLHLDSEAKVFKISLFCTESFNYNELKKFLLREGIKISDIKKFEIANGELTVVLQSNERKWPISELDASTATSCAYCQDFTGLGADLSCGNIASEADWTTVLVRTDDGNKVLREAIQAGLIEAIPLDAKDLQPILNSSRFKKNRYYKLR